MSIPDFSAAVCPCDSSHSWVPKHPSTLAVFFFTSCPQLTYIMFTVLGTTLHSHPEYLPWQNFPSPRFCCVAETGPSLNLCHCPSLGSPWWQCFFLWWWVIQKSSAASAPSRGLFTHSSLFTRVWLGSAPGRKLLGKGDNWHAGAVQWVLMAQGWYLIWQSIKDIHV